MSIISFTSYGARKLFDTVLSYTMKKLKYIFQYLEQENCLHADFKKVSQYFNAEGVHASGY